MWLCFGATCLQLAFLQPYVKIIPGTRTNLFSGLLCFLTLVIVVSLGKGVGINRRSPELWLSLGLLLLAGLSCYFSPQPGSAVRRAFVLAASALGGFWSARILLATAANQRLFRRLALLVLAAVLFLCFLSFLLTGRTYNLIHSNPHPLTDLILLLSFAPLSLLGSRSRPAILLGAGLLILSYLAFWLSSRISVLVIPIVLIFLGSCFRVVRPKVLLAVLVVISLCSVYFVSHLPEGWLLEKNKEQVYYRLEIYPFSLKIALEHPLWGIGLRAPRENFLEDYQVKYPYVSKQEFAESVRRIVSCDNIVLTFMVGLGFPFLITYFTAVFLVLAGLVKATFRPPPGPVFHPLALLFTLAAALCHYLIFDGLLFPQDSWYFHILLGLALGTVRLREEEGHIHQA